MIVCVICKNKGDEHMNILNKAITLLLLFVLCLMTACSSNNGADSAKKVHTSDVLVSPSDGSGEHINIVFDIENYGSFTVEAYPECAPETVKHFVELVEMGYYNGSTFEKINPGHSIVSSDKTALSSGECKETVTGEFYENGYSNDLPLTRGTLAMCYLGDEYNSATSKFMIILEDDHSLDGKYAGFAKVTDGIEVFDKMSTARVNAEGIPVSPIVMKKVYIKE